MKWASCLVIAAACGAAAMAQSLEPVRLSPFSGEPVPRFVSLRHAAVHGRVGPSLDAPIAWEYARQGLPVMIVKESGDWRRIRDHAGDEAWIHKSQLSAAPMAITMSDVKLLSQADGDAAPVANVEAGAMVHLGPCDAGFCSVRAGPHKGWAARSELWGAPVAGRGL